jgi:hypothetical protein
MPQDVTSSPGERRRRVVGTIAIATGLLGGVAVSAALTFVGAQVVAAFIPVAEEQVVGSWVSEEGGSESLVLRADGTAVAVDLGHRAEKEVTGSGTWSMIGANMLVLIEDAEKLSTLNYAVERSGLAVVLVEYIGDPDEGNGWMLVRDDQ